MWPSLRAFNFNVHELDKEANSGPRFRCVSELFAEIISSGVLTAIGVSSEVRKARTPLLAEDQKPLTALPAIGNPPIKRSFIGLLKAGVSELDYLCDCPISVAPSTPVSSANWLNLKGPGQARPVLLVDGDGEAFKGQHVHANIVVY